MLRWLYLPVGGQFTRAALQRAIGVFSLTELFGNILGAIGYIAVAGFISVWAHRAETEKGRAAKMGLYLTFGFLWFILFLVGASGAVNALRAGNDPSATHLFLLGGGVAAGIALIPYLRRPLARILPFDANSYPDMIALMFVLQAGVLAVFSMFVELDELTQVQYSRLIIDAITFAAIAYIGVGLFTTRTFRDATARLGLVRPTLRDIGIALGCVFIALAVSVGSSLLVEWLQPEVAERLQDTMTNLTGDLDIFWAALAIGVCAAVGEELLFRGAIQPRFGIVLTSLVFAVLHVQYDASLLIVGLFFASVVFGLERKYVNTTACVITHAVYNFIAVLATFA